MHSTLLLTAVVIFTGRVLTLDPDRPRAEGIEDSTGAVECELCPATCPHDSVGAISAGGSS